MVSSGPSETIQHLPPAIALAAGLSLAEGVEGFAALRQALQEVSLLLILDCAEHLADALAAPLAELIAATQALRVLVTSQAPLGAPGEVVYRLAVLPVPDAGTTQSDAQSFGSVVLFAQRAAAADRRFELSTANSAIVAQICRRLDGIPLALELAAARVPALGLATLLERLDDRFRLLKVPGQAADPRHGALHAAFDWSYGLLAPAEQRVFNRLGAFAGSFSLKVAAEAVADDSIDSAEAIDLIGRLVDRSLVTVLAVEPPRYVLLETARHYALGRLKAEGALPLARARMAEAMLELLDAAYEEYWSLDEALWLHRYAPEIDNVRAAMEWAMGGSPELGVALFGSAWPLFVETDLRAEGRDRYMQTLAHLSDKLPRARLGRFWEAIASYDASRQWSRARYAAELAAAAHGEACDTRAQYYALLQLASSWRVDTPDARASLEAARQLEDPAWPARLLAHGAMTEGALLMSAGEYTEARAAYQRAVRFALTTSERLALTATVSIVELDIACGDMAAALQLGRALSWTLRHLGRRETHLELLAMTFSALLLAGELEEARAIGAELYELAAPLENNKLCLALDAMAFLACEERRYEAAARIAACADAAHDAQGQARRRPAQERVRVAVLAALNERLGEAWRTSLKPSRERLNETGACALALGLSA
jgi:predicted ATPase